MTVVVEALEDAKVQIVLDGVSITNEDSPAIFVKSADKVFVTSTDSESHMEVSGSYVGDGDITIDTGKDALHSENDEDASLGYIYIKNGTLNITAVVF